MYRYEDLILRKFRFEDIPMKIEWINNSKNNVHLGYDLPLDYDKTCQWYERIKNQRDRFDAVVEYMGKPVGLFGLLHIDYKNKKAEDYSLTFIRLVHMKSVLVKKQNLLKTMGRICFMLKSVILPKQT